MSACTHAGSPATTAVATPSAAPRAPKVVRLVALPAESEAFPSVARAATDSLSHAQVAGLGNAQVSKVSLEVVQISIECVDSSAACYQAVGRSLTANGLLFAQIAATKQRQLKVTVTLFDVDARASRTKAEKVFESEDEATAGIPELVAEATRP
ncbi:MAG TPA: hypothetical protein VLM79_30310 [Kofleriaceae bacterium]|nr:hypothetical protein [Kofleriaceae bacterium]